MIKRILTVGLLISFLFTISWFVNDYLLANPIRFSLIQVYIFNAISAFVIYSIIEIALVYKFDKQAGYLYLTSMCIKIGIFILLFKSSIFSENPLTKPERLSIIVPFFLFLALEVSCIMKLLNKTS